MSARDSEPVSRRAFWSRAPAKTDVAVPPPWTDAAALAWSCTRCGACAPACPERIIVFGATGLPEIDFHRGACTFCGACADACPAPVFDRSQPAPWHVIAHIHTACLAVRGIVCQSCRDACPASAIQFLARPGGVAIPGVQSQRCTGCGACVGVCPSDAISIAESAHAG